jgi:hypothetical protein
MVPEISRRRVLAGGGVALGGAAGVGFVKPDWLASALPWAGDARSIPEYVWHPPVSETHADEAVATLEDTVAEAERLAEQVERQTGSPPRWADHPAGGWLEDARSESTPRRRLSDAISGLASVGHRIDDARDTLGEFETERLDSRASEVLSGAAGLEADLGDYPVSNPSRDLGYLFFVERQLGGAKYLAPVDAELGDGISSLHADLFRSEQSLENARYYSRRYQNGLDDDPRPVRSDVQEVTVRLDREIERLPSYGAVRSSFRDDIEDATRLYEVANRTLWRTCYQIGYESGYGDDESYSGLNIRQLVDAARELLTRRAYQFARSELDVSPDDTAFDRSRADEASRRARELYHSTRSEHESPLAGLLIEPGADAILTGDSRTDFGHSDENYLKATALYLTAVGVLREIEDVVSMVRL